MVLKLHLYDASKRIIINLENEIQLANCLKTNAKLNKDTKIERDVSQVFSIGIPHTLA